MLEADEANVFVEVSGRVVGHPVAAVDETQLMELIDKVQVESVFRT